jgi:hypothetical protein
MPAVTSSATTFNLDVDQIIEMALEPLGGEHTSAEEAEKARRVLNLLLIEMQNKNIPLSKLDFEDVTLTDAVATYTLNTNILKVLTGTLALAGTDVEMTAKSMQEYHVIPNKTTQNRPNCYMTQHTTSGLELTVWPVPNTISNGPYVAKLVVSRKIEDITASYQKVGLQPKYLPLLVAWFQYKLSITRVGISEEVRNRLQAEYTQMYADTVENDRENVDYRVVPGGISGR